MKHREFLDRIMEYFNRDIVPPQEDDHDGAEIIDPGVAGTPEVENYDAEEDVFPDDEDLQENADLKFVHPARKKVLRDILQLASGTIASLTDETNGNRVDKIRQAFFDWSINSDIIFDDWNDAWREYLDDYGVKYDKKGVINYKDVKKLVLSESFTHNWNNLASGLKKLRFKETVDYDNNRVYLFQTKAKNGVAGLEIAIELDSLKSFNGYNVEYRFKVNKKLKNYLHTIPAEGTSTVTETPSNDLTYEFSKPRYKTVDNGGRKSKELSWDNAYHHMIYSTLNDYNGKFSTDEEVLADVKDMLENWLLVAMKEYKM